MKKINFAKILTLVLACAALIGSVAGINASAADEQTIEIVSNNVYYGQTLQLTYAVDAPVLKDGDTIKLNVYYYEDGVKKPWCAATDEGTVTIKGADCRVFYSSKGVPVQDINTNLYAEASIVNAEGAVVCSDVQRYSVLEYLYERLRVSENVTDNQKAMYNAHLAYALAAEQVLYEDQGVLRASYTNPVKDYFYVNVDGATFDGGNTAGMYEKGATPLSDLDLGDTANKTFTFTANGVASTEDAVKALAISEAVLVKVTAEDTVSSVTSTLVLNDLSNRADFNTEAQIWKANEIAIINNKAGGSNIGDYTPPRFNKNSEITISVDIEGAIITEIVFECSGDTYANALKSSIESSDATVAVSVSGATVTVVFNDYNSNTFSVLLTGGQVRMGNKIEVTYNS